MGCCFGFLLLLLHVHQETEQDARHISSVHEAGIRFIPGLRGMPWCRHGCATHLGSRVCVVGLYSLCPHPLFKLRYPEVLIYVVLLNSKNDCKKS